MLTNRNKSCRNEEMCYAINRCVRLKFTGRKKKLIVAVRRVAEIISLKSHILLPPWSSLANEFCAHEEAN